MRARRASGLRRAISGVASRLESLVADPRWSMVFGAALVAGAVAAGFCRPDGGSLLEKAVTGETAGGGGVDSLARAPWFVGLEMLLLLGLAACLLRRFVQVLHDLRWPVFLETPEQVRRCAWSHTLFYPDTSVRWAVARQEAVLRGRDWTVRVLDGDGGTALLCAEYWRWGRLCSLVLHTGVVCLLAAVMVAPFTRTVERVETVAYRTLPLSERGFEYDLQIGDVTLEPVQGGKESVCRVSAAVVDRGLQLPPHEVRTGSPLHYRGMTVYLADWGRILDFRVREGDREGLLSVRNGKRISLPGAGEPLTVRLSPDLSYVAGEFGKVRVGETLQVGRNTLTFAGQRPYAVLVVKRGTGTGLALAGALMILGGFLLGRMTRLRRVWAVAVPGNGGTLIHLGGDTPDDGTVLAGLSLTGRV